MRVTRLSVKIFDPQFSQINFRLGNPKNKKYAIIYFKLIVDKVSGTGS